MKPISHCEWNRLLGSAMSGEARLCVLSLKCKVKKWLTVTASIQMTISWWTIAKFLEFRTVFWASPKWRHRVVYILRDIYLIIARLWFSQKRAKCWACERREKRSRKQEPVDESWKARFSINQAAWWVSPLSFCLTSVRNNRQKSRGSLCRKIKFEYLSN